MQESAEAAFGRLFQIIRRLRGPDGCAWDRKQSPETLRDNLIEEAYECVSAVTTHDDENLREELGDLFMIVTMLAWMKEEDSSFSLEGVLDGINEKLIRRHPHVFGEAKVESVDQIVDQWDRIKAEEKGARIPSATLESLPKSLPPLERARKIQEKVSKVGFDWKSPQPVWEKLHEEIRELREAQSAGNKSRIEEEIGDILFTVVNLSRILKVDPGLALHATNEKFVRRFMQVEERLREGNLTPAEAGLPRMDEIWDQIKAEERNNSK
jgi:MazG family protein